MKRVAIAALIALASSFPLRADETEDLEQAQQIDADQAACFGSNTEDECTNNAQANCTWKTVQEAGGPVSWCEMTLPWTPKEN